MSAVVSKKLKFKGEKSKKKKRSHHDAAEDDAALTDAGSPTDWIFPSHVLDAVGPSYILLPTTPPTCLAWNPTLQRVYAAPITLPVAPEGADELTHGEAMEVVEPTDVNHVWVIARLSGSEDVITLRSSSGTFLTAASSGALSASTPSRGPLECFTPHAADSSASSSSQPAFTLQSSSGTYLSVTTPKPTGDSKPALTASGAPKQTFELRTDVDAADLTDTSRLLIKCQREFVTRARVERLGGPEALKRLDAAAAAGGGVPRKEGTAADEAARNRTFQAWGGGKSVVSEDDRRAIKKAKKEGRINEAMLDRRAKLKSDKFC